MSTDQARTPAGTPAGGQFASRQSSSPATTLTARVPTSPLPDFDAACDAYIECALWSSHDTTEDGDDVELDGYEMHPDSVERMNTDLAQFAAGYPELVAEYLETGHSSDQFAHDFWLTRNGHGTGFWDRGLGSLGGRLSEAAKAEGGAELYVGDDGMVHLY